MGASGGIGQPFALLLKLNKDIAKLALYDIQGTPGVAADLSHVDSRAQVQTSLISCCSLHAAKGGVMIKGSPCMVKIPWKN